MTHVDLGIVGAKRKGDTDLLKIMRQVVLDNSPDTEPAKLVYLFIGELDDVNTRDALEYAAYNILRRVLVRETLDRKQDRPSAPPPSTPIDLIRERARKIMEANIALWTMRIPSAGKPLNECTFGELATVAPLTGQFLARLARKGEPNQLVREVFKDENQLQDFWRSCQ